MFYAFGKFLCKVFFHLYLKTKVIGDKNIPPRGSFIVAGNHVSFLDPVAFGIASPRRLNYMARDTLFRNRLFGWVLRHVSVFPLKRNSANIGAIKEALRRLGNGEGLLLFPEGTRSANGCLKDPLEGVGFLARKSGASVIPAYVQGTDKALPKGAKFIKPKAIRVIFGEAVVFPQDKNLSDEDVTAEIMRRIAVLRDSLRV